MSITTKDTKQASCDKHGEYTSSLIVGYGREQWTQCYTCVRERDNEIVKQQQLKDLAESKFNRMKSIINRAAIPEAFQHCTFDNYVISSDEQGKTHFQCKYFAENFNDAMRKNIQGLLVGGVGTGKSHLACAIASTVIKSGYTAVFITMNEIKLAIKECFKRESDKTELSIMNDFTKIDLLIIDEAAINVTEFECEVMFNIINKRYSNNKPTLVLTNEIDKLKEKLGDRTMSRLMSSGFIQYFTWGDFRLKQTGDK
jgi:DNA replication protein DnaC